MATRALASMLLLLSAGVAEEKFNDSIATVYPFPRGVARGKTLTITGRTAGKFRNAQLVIIAPNGKTFLNKDNTIREAEFTFRVRFEEGRGRYRMEIMASKPNSIRSAARFDVFYGRPVVDEPEPPVPQGPPIPLDIHPRLIEKRFVSILNEFRARIGLKPVRWNEAVAARAREHAWRMARAKRRVHGFAGVGGVVEMLRDSGAGDRMGFAGPDTPWANVRSRRPFDRPAPQPPEPKVWNQVVPFVVVHRSIEAMFERYFVREAAFRICAADPFCLEVGVGAARTPVATTTKPEKRSGRTTTRLPSTRVYFSVCFVQINDKTIIAGQARAHARLLKLANARQPYYLRTLGRWGRTGARVFAGAMRDRRSEVAGAAIDGLLLLDEPRARNHIRKVDARARKSLERKLYGPALALWSPFGLVTYDRAVSRAGLRQIKEIRKQARLELDRTTAMEQPARTTALKDLLRRCAGMKIAEEIRKAIE